MSQYDQTGGAIGKRYRRQDEIGTPLCVTVDFQSLEDQAVTIRERDSMAQVRVPIAEWSRRCARSWRTGRGRRSPRNAEGTEPALWSLYPVVYRWLIGGYNGVLWENYEGSGHSLTETRPVSTLHSVALETIGTLLLEQGESEQLVVEGEENILAEITTEVADGQLTISTPEPNTHLRPTQLLVYRLTVRELDELMLSSSGSVEDRRVKIFPAWPPG